MAVVPATPPTQESTQSTQQDASQTSGTAHADRNIWGSLIPFNPLNKHATRIDFYKNKRKYTLGRSRREGVNDFSFPLFPKMSQTHCVIEWDGVESSLSAVVVQDLNSSNGTYINGRRIPKGECRVLHDWCQISFGPIVSDPEDRPKDDYRYFFRHMATRQRAADEGLYATYDVQHVLGRGAYATVVKALHRRECAWYAVKLFSGDKLRQMIENSASNGHDRGETTSHLQKEVQILERLEHPNICKLKEAFYEGYSVSVVIELVTGGDLMSYMLKHDVLLEPEARDITFQVCDALTYMHRMGVVHRDLKPENVLLTEDHPPFVKVADFGLAKVLDSLSMLQTKCGTPAFIAPEVFLHGSVGYDKVVDSWSLGVMVYMMLTKNSPFHDPYHGDPDWNLLHEYNIFDEGEDFLRQLLEYRPERRMTPEQALTHPWVSCQKETVTRRRVERENSLRAAAAATNRLTASRSSGTTIRAASFLAVRRTSPGTHSSALSGPSTYSATTTPTPSRAVTPAATFASASTNTSMSIDTSTYERANTPSTNVASKAGAKRKAGDIGDLGRSLSSMFVNEDYVVRPMRKRPRLGTGTSTDTGLVGVDPETIIPASHCVPRIPPLGYPPREDADMDEVPGLGMWHGTNA